MVDLLHQMLAQSTVRLIEETSMPIDKSKITDEMLAKAAMCQTADDLIALAKDNGIDITREEAESYLDELENVELDKETLDKVAGGDGTTRTINAKLYG